MNRGSLHLSTLVLIWVFVGFGTDQRVVAQNAAATRVAVVDMSLVFKSSEYFVRERGILKDAISNTEQAAKVAYSEIEKIARETERAEQGSDEHQVLDARAKEQRFQFEAKKRDAQRIILKREAEIYHHTYSLVIKAIEEHAKEHQIDLVLRHTSEPPDLKNTKPDDLINRVVLYQKGIDVTDDIIRRVNAVEKQPDKANPNGK